jgi:hypothetical protein
MGLSTYPAPSGGGIKSVQRGSAGSAGTVTITAVDTSKSFVTIFGTASSGSVAAAGNFSGNVNTLPRGSGQAFTGANNTSSINANFTAGTTNLVSAVVQGHLTGSTSLVVSGACRWEVVEFA